MGKSMVMHSGNDDDDDDDDDDENSADWMNGVCNYQ